MVASVPSRCQGLDYGKSRTGADRTRCVSALRSRLFDRRVSLPAFLLLLLLLLGTQHAWAQSGAAEGQAPTEPSMSIDPLDACQRRLSGFEKIVENERNLRLAAQERVSQACPLVPNGPEPVEQGGAAAAQLLADRLDALEGAIDSLLEVRRP